MRFVLVLLLLPFAVFAESDPRYCGAAKRDAMGEIVRNSAVPDRFQRIHPCPANGQRSGPCPGWERDHVIPLACGGCDSIANMQWLPDEIKNSPGRLAKDRWERKVYCR